MCEAGRSSGKRISRAERALGKAFRSILNSLPTGADIQDWDELRDVSTGLEYFIPEVLSEIYSEWDYECLDGIHPQVARKTGEREVEIFGLCDLMSDQTQTPIHAKLQVSAFQDEITWLECKLGQMDETGIMVRKPFGPLDKEWKRLFLLEGRDDAINWVYQVTYGRRQP